MRKDARKQFEWTGRLEQLEERLVMSANPLTPLSGGQAPLGELIQHHAIDGSLPPLQHHVANEVPPALDHHLQSKPDFWIDRSDQGALEDEFKRIEQALTDAHNQSGMSQVRSNYGFQGTGQTVAIIDSGIAYDHFALGGGLGSQYRVVGGYDFTGENDADPYDDGPAGSHGTHVSGIVGAQGGSQEGVAPGVDLVGLRVFDDAGNGYFHWVEYALDWIHTNRNSFANPITAVNLSIGVASWNAETIPLWANLEEEFAQLRADGIFISVSAGNSFNAADKGDADGNGTDFGAPGLSYPAGSQYVIPVASVDDNGLLSYYSQRNSRVIAAPGRGIISTVPDYAGNNNGITDDYASFSGTSMAAPYVAGASVIIREAMEFVGYTNITQDTIYDHMVATADQVYDSVTGFNYNRLNMSAAIDALMPADDYGSTIATAHNLGTVGSSMSLSGAIAKLDDVDYFKFTAANTGTVTFTSSNMTNDIAANWEVSGGTGTWSGADNEVFTVDVVAGQQYTVGFSSQDGLGYYDLDITSDSTFTFTDWGAISFSELAGLAVSGQSWYRVEASAAGYLTAQALFDAGGGQISLELYDSQMQLIDTGNAAGGESRVDMYAAEQDEFFLKVLGNNNDVDFRLTNLVSVVGTTVNIDGTTADDVFAFTAGSTHQVSVNGVSYDFASISVTAIDFNGGAGNDSITFTGGSGDETATLRVGTATFVGAGFAVSTTGVHTTNAIGGGGVDTVIFKDSAGDDLFEVWSDHGDMTGTGYSNQAQDFDYLLGYSTTGNDVAMVYDSTGDDTYKTWSDRVFMKGANYYSFAQGFGQTFAFASSGNDIAFSYDSTGNDTYEAWSDHVRMQGDGYQNNSQNFEETYAYASAGNDTVLVYDSAGDDHYRALPDAVLITGAGFLAYANGFDQSYGYSSAGNDRVTMYDSAGNDTYEAWADRVLMTGNGYVNSAEGFARTYAYASTGFDQVTVHDSAGDDLYKAWFDRLVMTGTGYFAYANGFDESYAYSTSGTDRATFYDSAGDDLFQMWSDRAQMTGPGYLSYAEGFAEQYGNGSVGYDRAILYDSLGDDNYRAWLGRALMTGNGFFNYAYNFDQIEANSSQGGNDVATLYDSTTDDQLEVGQAGISLSNNDLVTSLSGFYFTKAVSTAGGTDTAEVEAVDYLFSLIGDWNA